MPTDNNNETQQFTSKDIFDITNASPKSEANPSDQETTPEPNQNLIEAATKFLKAKTDYDASKTALDDSKRSQEMNEDASSEYDRCVDAHSKNKKSLQDASKEFLNALRLPKKTWSETFGRDYEKTKKLADMVTKPGANLDKIQKNLNSRRAVMEELDPSTRRRGLLSRLQNGVKSAVSAARERLSGSRSTASQAKGIELKTEAKPSRDTPPSPRGQS